MTANGGTTKVDDRPYQAWYAKLLRLYPRPFRERFGEGMAQTFNDLCRERRDAGRRLFGLASFGFALWIFCETLGGIVMENVTRMNQMGKTTLRVALVALGLLMVPLVASRFVPDWNWPPGAFVRVYLLFFVVGMAYALIARKMGAWTHKVAVGIALFGGFALGWSTMVQTADSGHPERLWYLSVLVVGLIGAGLARLRARGLAWTLFAMAATLAVIAVVLPSGAPPDMALRMAIGHGVYVALFTAAGLLFRHASLAESK
jgi:MFS family permease